MKPAKNLQYTTLARYYDLVYSWKDYAREARQLRKVISKFKESTGRALLDIGCGSGKHLSYLCKNFDCTGIDLQDEMLRMAKKNVPCVKFIRANMTSFHLDQKFDVLLCLFSAIGYIRTWQDFERTIQNFSNHLKKGGVAIIEPWYTRANWDSGSIRGKNHV